MSRPAAGAGLAVLALALAPAACDGGGPGNAAPAGGGPRRVAVIPKGTTHVFWQSVERGARRAGEELGARIIWKGPLQESDRAGQIQLVESFTGEKVDGIVLAPLDRRALVRPVREAGAAGIPVVIFDSALEGRAGADFASFVATDNRSAGRLGGAHLAGVLGGAGKVVLLRYQVGSASTDEREAGFLEALGTHPAMEVLVENRYAGATAGEAKTQALNMIDQIRQAGGIFCPNESSTYGMLLALRQEGLAGRVRLVGFDASPPLVQALAGGEIDALVVQDPEGMGYKAVEALLRHLDGLPVEPFVDTGAVLVTKKNMDDPKVRPLLP